MTRTQFENLLSINIPDIYNKNVYIWGTGNTAQLYYEGFKRLETETPFKIKGYGTNNSDVWGGVFNGKKIYSVDEIMTDINALVLICSPQVNVVNELKTQFSELKLNFAHIDEAILKNHKSEVLEVYDMLEDDFSKETYANVIKARMEGTYPESKFYDSNVLFPNAQFMALNSSEVFVDCGAFVGDSTEKFIWGKFGTFKKIIAFEPDTKNCDAMKKRVERLKQEWNLNDGAIEILNAGVGGKTEFLKFARNSKGDGLGARFEQVENPNEADSRIYALDDFMKMPYTFLKADIESYEYGMLKGAEKGIKENKPLMAIAIYHNAVDLYSIPLLIKQMVGEYKFMVRHHHMMLYDTLLYAYV